MSEKFRQDFPPRREVQGRVEVFDHHAESRFRLGLRPGLAVVLLSFVALLGTIGVLRVLVPTSASAIGEESFSQSSVIANPGGERDISEDESQSREVSVLVVYVTGAVIAPGVVEVEAASRLEAAVLAAGGLTESADLSQVNLARIIEDGEHVHVPIEGEEPQVESEAASSGCVDLNRADATQLETLDGVGPKIADRIVTQREAIGGFKTVEELMSVSGIGQKLFNRIAVGLCGS